jgi:hypothetical protein
MRRQFRLPEHDEEYLEALGRPWETIVEGGNSHGNRWLLVRDFGVPTGYTHAAVDVAINIAPTYPDVQLDMAWFHPHLGRRDGRGLGAVGGGYRIDGRDWQRWSRHRTAANPWRPGVDDVSTHLVLVTEWLAREFR